MLKFIFWSLLCASLALFAYGQGYLGNFGGNEHDPARLQNQLNGAKLTDAPSLAETTLTGSAFDVAQHRGKVVVLNSWASWCDPCREELPVLVPLSKAVNPADITFVGLDVNDTASAAAARVKEFGIPYPSIVDDGAKKLSMIPGVPPGAIPSTVVIDRHGRIAARVIGAVKPGVLDPVLADLAAEK